MINTGNENKGDEQGEKTTKIENSIRLLNAYTQY